MIAVYAQASGRQGLESAINGAVVENDDPQFLELRERGRITVDASPIQIGAIELRYSRGVARLVFDDTDGDQDGSPITVVLKMDQAREDLDAAVSGAVGGVRAIHRNVDSMEIRAALKVATDVHTSHLTRRRIIIAGGIVVAAGVVLVAAVLIATALPKQ